MALAKLGADFELWFAPVTVLLLIMALRIKDCVWVGEFTTVESCPNHVSDS